MAKTFLDSSLLDRAIVFAVNAHRNMERRGKGFPYIVHPLEAVSIVSTITADQTLLAAAALHDVIEDTECTVEELRREFGDKVAELVVSESDVYHEGEGKSDSWHRRKQEAINRISNSSLESKIVAMGDKLSNMRAIRRDYERMGDSLWEIFNEKRRSEHEWHYRGLAMALSELSGTAAYNEFVSHLEYVFSQKPEKIDMKEYEESGDGYTAVSYNHCSGETMVKLYYPFVPMSVPLRELRTSRVLYDMGLKTPRALRFVTDGTRYGAEFERITQKASFSRVIADHPEKLEDAVATFASHCRELHSTECDTSFFPSQIDVARRQIQDSKLFTEEEKKPMYAFLDRHKKVTTCLHGDMHIGNMITRGDECWWIDLADFSYGDPHFDLGLFFLIVKYMPPHIPEGIFHMPHARLECVWNTFLQKYLGVSDQQSVEKYEQELLPYAALTMVRFNNLDGFINEQMKKFVIDNLR